MKFLSPLFDFQPGLQLETADWLKSLFRLVDIKFIIITYIRTFVPFINTTHLNIKKSNAIRQISK